MPFNINFLQDLIVTVIGSVIAGLVLDHITNKKINKTSSSNPSSSNVKVDLYTPTTISIHNTSSNKSSHNESLYLSFVALYFILMIGPFKDHKSIFCLVLLGISLAFEITIVEILFRYTRKHIFLPASYYVNLIFSIVAILLSVPLIWFIENPIITIETLQAQSHLLSFGQIGDLLITSHQLMGFSIYFLLLIHILLWIINFYSTLYLSFVNPANHLFFWIFSHSHTFNNTPFKYKSLGTIYILLSYFTGSGLMLKIIFNQKLSIPY